ncbi:MAG TPA: DUF5703 domain-containing protein [Fimbriimonas sp.]|nr:DUF5703 domain-containing protein [Fimbriimonas sp.]
MLLTALAATVMATPDLSAYDVLWNTPSKDAAGSMPIGNGEVVLNAWVEDKTGDLLFYIARSDALSEISRILKLGRVRIHTEPSLFKGAKNFWQHLVLQDGLIRFESDRGSVKLFVDADQDVIYIRGNAKDPVKVRAEVESWRNQARKLPKEEQGSAWSVHDAPFDLIESADVFMDRDEVTWYHRNESSITPKLLENQSLVGQKGAFDPLLHRTFGGRMTGAGMKLAGQRAIEADVVKEFDVSIATHSAQTNTVEVWRKKLPKPVAPQKAEERTKRWWNAFWDRSWVFVEGDNVALPVPENNHALRKGEDSNGENRFPGEISEWGITGLSHGMAGHSTLTLSARIKPEKLTPGRIFDKLTAGKNDGYLFDTYPGDGLRFIAGNLELTAPKVLKQGVWQEVKAVYDESTGSAYIYIDGKKVAERETPSGSAVTRGYLLQRYVQACQGRGKYPIKFNGGYYTVEPTAMGKPFDPDFRNWGDCHWFQNVRHMYHPMMASGDLEMAEPFWRLYEDARPLAEARSTFYHGSKGAYFPETMTVSGLYSGGDYGWDRKGHEPKEVLCPWWDDAWNQGPELVALMLDRWDYSRDERFLKQRVLPMAESVLRYFDTRFKKDENGRIVLDPTQVVETYWEGVVNDMPTTAGLVAITDRLTSLPAKLTTKEQKTFFAHMKAASPELPLEIQDDIRQLAPAQKYNPKTSNVENGELYAVWPFRVVTVAQLRLLEEAKVAYANRKNHLDIGWGYDGNVAALLGMANEAARILRGKCANSHPAYRWPATWGPNFDWLPDQNHGGNLLNTTNLMLLQADPIEQGGAIRVLPAWPKTWDVDFKLHAPGKTTVRCVVKAGKIQTLEITPPSRAQDLVLPRGW